MSIKLRWLGFNCFEVVLPSGKVIVTDPFIDLSWTAPIKSGEVTGADYITLTHADYDHVTDVGPLVQKFNSKVICSYQVAEPLANFFNFSLGNLIKVTAGNTVVFDDLKVEVKKAERGPMRHVVLPELRKAYQRATGKEPSPGMSLAELQKALPPHPQFSPALIQMRQNLEAAGVAGGEQLNFVFQIGDNLRIYLFSAAPHEFLRHEVMEAHPHVFIAQLGGNDPEKMAEIAALSGAEVVIPSHYEHGEAEKARKQAQAMAKHLAARSTAHFEGIVHGKWYEIGAKVSAI